MKLGVAKETRDGEARVAASPESIKKLTAAGHDVLIEAGAGAGSSFTDGDFQSAGATVGSAADAWGADVVLCVRGPTREQLGQMKPGAGLVGLLEPYDDRTMLDAYASARVDAFAMEFTPRITRAQSMDALSSQANLAGYRAVIEASQVYGRALPMMMTAAGTVAAAKCFVMGAGVAGLQAIATAKRLGAIVSATDVRPAAKEQVESLAAKFVAVEDEEFQAAQDAGGYAKEMSDEYKQKQAELTASHIAKQDIVITTALIPGRPAPRLITAAMVASMRPGSVIVDIATARGGNVEGAVKDQIVTTDGGATIIGWSNLPGRLASDASALYAKNLLNLSPLLTADEGAGYAPKWDDEIIQGMALTRDGAVVHPNFAKETA